MNSFYGGKKGAPFIIVCSYPTVAAMAADFSKGFENTAVQFDEYVIINTVNKNDPDNGRIYRRGYNLEAIEEEPRWTEGEKTPTRQTGGGEYVGTIVGPAGHAPKFVLTTMKDVDEQQNIWLEKKWEVRKGEGSYGPIDMNIIPGYTGEHPTSIETPPDLSNSEKFNDEILWNYISIRDTNNSDTTAYVGFKIPYTVFNYTAQSVSPYYNRDDEEDTDNFTNINLIDRQSISEKHPFYEYWDLKIPKGIKGDSFQNLRVIHANENDNIKNYGDDKQEDDRKEIPNNRTEGTRQIMVYDYRNFDRISDGDMVSEYLGDYNVIKHGYFDKDGTIQFDYTHDNPLIENTLINWINHLSLDYITGDFKVRYNNDNFIERDKGNFTEEEQKLFSKVSADYDKTVSVAEYNTRLKWVDRVSILEDGRVKLEYTTEHNKVDDNGELILDDEGNKILEKDYMIVNEDEFTYTDRDGKEVNNIIGGDVKWIKDINLDDGGTLRVTYNNNSEPSIFVKKLKWIKDITLSENGTLTIDYNNQNGDKHPDYESKILQQCIQRIDGIELNDDGTLTVIYNTFKTQENDAGEEEIIQPQTKNETVFSKKLQWIKDIKINTEKANPDNPNQKLSILYNNTEGEWEDIGEPLNFITKVAVNPENAELLIKYSDPQKLGDIEYKGENGWNSLGFVRDYSGWLNGLILDASEESQLLSNKDAKDYLDTTYPDGLKGADLATKTVAIRRPEGLRTVIFAFDYSPKNSKKWQPLGYLETDAPSIMCAKDEQGNPTLEEKKEELQVGGIWLVEEDA